jgi:TonB-linked SusC/RagA family outer membrane protein
MEKNVNVLDILQKIARLRVFIIMKLTVFFICFSVLSSIASGTYSQSSKISLNLNNTSIKYALKEIENTTNYYFLYNNDLIDVEKTVSVQIDSKNIEDVLDQLFKDENVKYVVMERQIIITPKNSSNQTVISQREITGQVTDSSGDPLPGVTVVLKGTTNGTITDFDGNYTIQATADDVLVFSFVGMASREVLIGDKRTISITLQDEAIGVDEVVVVGYGVQKRSDITGSVTSVPSDRLGKVPVTNLMHAIEGSTAGLNITQTSSVPGSSGDMQIRGVNSINANTSPFIVLDGIPFFGVTNDINPNDIESIEILKDASAVAIYGTRGTNGVILITTKRGNPQDGKPKITYNGHVGIESIAHKLQPMGPEQYIQKYTDYHVVNGLTQQNVLPNQSEIENYNLWQDGQFKPVDWLDEATQTGIIQDHSISISGGTDKMQYFVSGGYLDEKGVVKGYQFKRASFRSNIDAKINDYLKIGTSTFFTNNNYDGGRVNFLEATAMSPFSKPRDENGNYITYPMSPELLWENPLLGLTEDRLDRNMNLTGNGYIEVTPGIPGLKYRMNASYIFNINRKAGYSGRASNDQSGTATVDNSQTDNWVIENILSYTKDFDKHHIDFTGLYSAQEVKYFRSWGTSRSFINDALTYYKMSAGVSQSIDSEGNKYSLLSQMGRLNYSYDSRYLFTFTARRDGYSAFGANTSKYGMFPSVALGWNIANESFMQDNPVVQQLKLRLSYGTTGNMAIDVNQTQSTAETVQYPFEGTAYTGILNNKLGNANLNWETTTSTNIGVDFSLFDFRVSGSVEAYKTKTDDILLKRNLPGITGYSNIWANLGKMQNIGLDITLKTVNIKTNEFEWTTDFNFSTYRNEILELYGDGKDDVGNRWFIGKPLNSFYDYEKLGIWQQDEDPSGSDPIAIPGDLKFKDQLSIDTDGDGVADKADGQITGQEDRVVLGRTDPSWTGGFTNTINYKNFSLRAFFQISHGGLKRNNNLQYADLAFRRNVPSGFEYWTEENQSNYWPSLAAYKNYRGYGFPEDWSYVRLKDVTLSYKVPQSVLNKYQINSLTLFVTGRNLHTWTNWFGWDPEMSYIERGADNWTNNYPPIRTISFGVNLTL